MDWKQKGFLSSLCLSNPNAVIVGSIGSISVDLKDIPHKNKILVKGFMGGVLGIGLGYALGTSKEVIVVIGDGAFLMKMGGMATILKYAPKNLKVYVLNNGVYKSCGGQETMFSTIKDIIPFKVIDA